MALRNIIAVTLHRTLLLRSTIAVLAFLMCAIAASAAEEPYAFERAPGRLPKQIIPKHYAIELEPNLDSLSLAGSELIDIEVREPSDKLVLNAVGMTLADAIIEDTGMRPSVVLDAAAETATLTFPQTLAAGAYKLRVTFTAQINTFARGMFVVDYPAENGPRRMISTHLEPADARRVFPCWDEPAFKASIALTVTLPRSFLPISNMPIAREEPVTPTLKQVSFATTPKMSTYLFVLTAGELERVSTMTDGVMIGVFNILAHEIAHQWFGNLVTMAWWDNLWLNEGFASWMQAKAAEHFFPQWKAWLNSNAQKQSAMNLDARRTSHPIQQPVANESEALAAFDAITYSKGQALIRMLESYVGASVFRAGMRKYIADHAYGNTTSADLWQALEAVSGKPVTTIARSFTQQPGVPLIVVRSSCLGEEQRVHLRQDRFTIRDPHAPTQHW